MKKGAAVSFAAWFLVAAAVLLVAEVHETAAANCNPLELRPCLDAITGSAQPSSECCSNLKAQMSCLCSYMKNPIYSPFINSPNAKKVETACGVTLPTC